MKLETKITIAAVVIPAIVTLLALAPFPQGIKIIGDLVFQERADHQTTPASGQGIFWVRSDGKPMYTDESGIDIDLSAGGGGGSGDLVGPGSSTDNAIMRYDGTTGKLAQDSEPTVNDTGSITMGSGDTVDGRDLSVDGTKLDGIEAGADDNPTDAEIETAYNNQVSMMSQAEAEAGVATTRRGVSSQVMAWAIAAQAGSGGDPTYGSDAGANDDAVYVDENNWLGLGITNPLGPLHVYSGTAAPRTYYQYFNDDAGDVTQYPTSTSSVTSADESWASPNNANADDDNYALSLTFSPPKYTEDLKSVYDFDIPTDATVEGVKIEVQAACSGLGGTSFDDVYLVRGGTKDTSQDRASGETLTTTYDIYTFGGPTDDWGGITPTEINATDFGSSIQFYMATANASVDFVRITIYYTDSAGNWLWSSGIDNSDGAFTVRTDTDVFRIGTDGAVGFSGPVTADSFIGDGSGLTNLPGTGDVDGPGASTDNALARYDGTTGKLLQNSEPTVSDSGSITMGSGDTVDGRDLSVDGAKLDGIADNATANTGTVTSAAVTGTDGIEVDSGSPITTSGTFTLGINAANLFAHLMGASTVTVDVADSLLIADASNAGALRDVSVSNFVLALSGSDNAIMKQVGATGQTEASGLTIDDSNNLTVPGDVNGHTIPSGSSDFVVAATAQTLTDKRIIPRKADEVCCVVDVDASLIDLVKTTLTNNATVSEPTGLSSLEDGETLMYMFKQGASAYTLTWDTNIFKAGDDWLGDIPVMGTTNGNWDYYLWMWNDDRGELHLLACSQGN